MQAMTKRIVVSAAMVATMSFGAEASGKSGYSLLRPTPDALLRDMATDRPDKTESPITVDAGRAQVELDFLTYTRDRSSGLTARTWDVLPFNLKVGLTAATELQIGYGVFSHERVKDAGSGTRESGTGDIVVRMKHNLWGNDGGRTALAVMPFVKLPAGTHADLNDHVEGGFIVPYSVDLGSGWELGMMGEIDILRRERGGGYAANFVASAALGVDVTERIGLFAELYAERSAEDGAETAVTVGGGVTYALTRDVQLDAAVNIGATDAADDLNLLAGLTQRF